MKLLLTTLIFFFTSAIFAQELQHDHSQFYALTENKGQWPEDVLFQSRSQGQNIWVQQHGFLFEITDKSTRRHADFKATQTDKVPTTDLVGVHFLGSQAVTTIEKELPSSYYYNYFMGSDSSKWASDVRSFQQVTLKDFYPNTDLKVFDHHSEFKYELWCHPGSDPSQISVRYSGSKALKIDGKGNLIVTTENGMAVERAPVAYQLFNGNLTPVSCAFILKENTVTFKTGKYNPGAILIIDPVLVFATYAGSPSDNFGMTATYGFDGSAYSGGTVFGSQYPTPAAAYDITANVGTTSIGGAKSDVFISKYSSDGSQMLWTNFLGGLNTAGDGSETVHSLICDNQNNIYFFGATSSRNFPVTDGSTHQGGNNLNIANNGAFFDGGTDIFVSKLSSNGMNLLASRYIGGEDNDGVNYTISAGTYSNVADYDSLTSNYGDQFRGEIMLDAAGNCIIASCTHSEDFPVKNAFQNALAGKQDGVIFKLNPSLSDTLWSSYFGGTENDACYSVKIDSSFNIVFAGGTLSDSLPGILADSWNEDFLGGVADGFVSKLTPNGQTVTRTTYIGTTNYDQAMFVEINRNDEIFVYGQSRGGLFPIVNATGTPGASQFIIKLNPALTGLLNSTTFGNGSSNLNISPSAFLVDICGNMYVSGWGANILAFSGLTGMQVTPDAYQSSSGDGFNFYLAVFDRDFDGMLYGSYLGGSQAAEHVDGGTSRFDKNGVVYQSVCGGCSGTGGGFDDFPTTPDAWSNLNLSTRCNNVVFKFDFQLIPRAEFTTDNLTGCEDFTVQLENTSTPSDSYVWDFGNGETTSVIFNPVITYTEPGAYEITLAVTDSICLLTDTARITVNVFPELQLSASNDTSLCAPESITLNASGSGSNGTIIWSSNNDFSDTLNTVPASSITVFPEATTTYYVQNINPGCSKTDSVTVTILGGSLEITGNDSICSGETTTLTALISSPGVTFTYLWEPSAILAPTGQPNVVVADPTTSQWVNCTATGSNGCVIEDSVFIAVGQLSGAVFATVSPDSVVAGQTVTLTANPPGYEYVWSPQEGVADPFAQITTAVVNEETTYTVTVSDEGCSRSATVKVYIIQTVCGGRFVYVPNAFSPNGDKQNDKLFVYSAVLESIEFRIFDRWGELIFESYSLNDGWDGTFRGKLVDPDVYDYYLKAVCLDGEEKIIKGNITLIR